MFNISQQQHQPITFPLSPAASLTTPVQVFMGSIKQEMPPDEAPHCLICQGNSPCKLHGGTARVLSWLCALALELRAFILTKQSFEVAGFLLCWYPSGKQELPCVVLLPSSLSSWQAEVCSVRVFSFFVFRRTSVAPSNTHLITALPCAYL